MSRILHSRFFRCLVCFVLTCCILVASSPFRVQATSAGLAGVITGAASVSVSAPMVIGATLIALGLSAGINGTAGLEAVVDSAVSHLESAGTYIKDGCVELLQTINSAGEKAYYVAGEMMDDLRSWVYDASVVSPAINSFDSSNQYSGYLSALSDYCSLFGCSSAYVCFINKPDIKDSLIFSQFPFTLCADGYYRSYSGTNETSMKLYNSSSVGSSTFVANAGIITQFADQRNFFDVHFFSSASPAISALDLTLGYLPSQDTELDDTTVVTFHPYLANVIKTRTGGSGGSGDEPENKWWLSLAFAESLDNLYETTQQFQIETPSVTEIPDIQVGIEYDITEEEDEDGDKYFVLDPVTTPGTGTDPGTGTNPDTGDGSGDNTGSDTGTTSGTGTATKPSSFFLDLRNYFPFCIPFDIGRFLKALIAPPVAPVFHWEVQDLSGNVYEVDVDLSPWDPHAALFRDVELALFIVGLALITRKLIKW